MVLANFGKPRLAPDSVLICVEDMMNGPCRESFEDSFRCFMKSEHPEVKGYDCLEHFEGFQACLANNPGHIEEFLLRNKENE